MSSLQQLSSIRNCMPQAITGNPLIFPPSGNSARHRVHQVIDAEFKRRGSIVEGSAAFIEPFPEFADVVIVVDDHLQTAVGIPETQKLDGALARKVIGGNHLEGVDLVKRI